MNTSWFNNHKRHADGRDGTGTKDGDENPSTWHRRKAPYLFWSKQSSDNHDACLVSDPAPCMSISTLSTPTRVSSPSVSGKDDRILTQAPNNSEDGRRIYKSPGSDLWKWATTHSRSSHTLV